MFDAQGDGISSVSVDLWSEDPDYTAYKRPYKSCVTNSSGICVIEGLEFELPGVHFGIGNSDCVVDYGRLPKEAQDIQITLRFTN